MAAWLKALFLAVIPSPAIAIASCACAGILYTVNFALIVLLGGLLKEEPLRSANAFVHALQLLSAPTFYLTIKMSFIPNLAGVFFLLLSNSGKNRWLINLSTQSFYYYAACYGIIICTLAIFTYTAGFIHNMTPWILLCLTLSPSASVAGIITLKMVKAFVGLPILQGRQREK